MNKASEGDRIPVELFQILKGDAVKVLHSVCQQIWKTQQWPQDQKRSVFIPIPKKGNAKECSNYHTIALISHASKVMLKIIQDRPQQYMNHELPDSQAGFRKGRGIRDQTCVPCIVRQILNQWTTREVHWIDRDRIWTQVQRTSRHSVVSHCSLSAQGKVTKNPFDSETLTDLYHLPAATLEGWGRRGQGQAIWV